MEIFRRDFSERKTPKTIRCGLPGWMSGFAISFALSFPLAAAAQDSPEDLLRQARELYQGQATPRGDLERIQSLLDQVVEDYPASDLAVSILLKDEIEGLDLEMIEQGLATDESSAPSELAASTDTLGEDHSEQDLVACLVGKLQADALRPMTLSVQLDVGGALIGIPSLEAPAAPDAETRGAFFQFVAALDECTPFPTDFSGKEVVATVDEAGVISVEQGISRSGTAIAAPGEITAPRPVENSESVSAEPAEANRQPSIPFSPVDAGDQETEREIGLEKSEIRDLQARLLVLGHDPNGVDGLLGGGTRAALSAWQEANGIERTGFLSSAQLAILKNQSDQDLAVWLEEPQNAALYDPPILSIGPSNISGSWSFTSNCGSNSKLGKMRITGVMSMSHVGGNRYSGRARQSQGLNGRVSGQLQGRQISGEINWGLLVGRVRFNGTVADEALVIQGADSNRCSFYARKS